MEALVGGMRYEMVELPDSLVDTTVFVGNLCEFVSDEDLSSLFQQVSSLNFLPACVARKPNSSSMCYGFVTFPTIQEKESAIIRFSGYVLNDKAIRVEPIIDYKFRVRVPEKLGMFANES
jgi:RNA recognition motif-containing protein